MLQPTWLSCMHCYSRLFAYATLRTDDRKLTANPSGVHACRYVEAGMAEQRQAKKQKR
jgi:hypothetical protein